MKIISVFLALQLLAIPLLAQEWVVPADRKGRLSPFRFDDNTRKEGERLYNINCKSCHGTPGMGDYQANLVPPPADPAKEAIQKNLDGELFYKIGNGRGPMPAFRNSLNSAEIWNIISFIRSFKKDYIQEIMPVIKSAAYPGAEIVLRLLSGPAANEITVLASAVTEKSAVPVTNAGVMLFVRRSFGRMMIDEEKSTDSEGKAVFSVPAGLPGDSAGNLRLTAKFTDEEAFGAEGRDTVLTAGSKVIPVSLTAPRAMWNTGRKAPLWILLTYILGVLGVWTFIFLILFKLRDIYIIGEHAIKTIPGAELKDNN
jgi:hypothetical protein